MRIALLACLIGVIAVLSAAAALPPAGSSLYTVRPDPRLCPSPICGGYWIALANRKQTRCADGQLRARCYAARAVDENRHPLEARVPANAIVRGSIEPWVFEGVGTLGTLVAGAVWTPVGGTSAAATVYRLRDLGIRCVRAPCYWLRLTRLNSASRATASDLELAATGASQDELERAEMALGTSNGLFASGRIVPGTDGGRVFRATRIFLRAAGPRA